MTTSVTPSIGSAQIAAFAQGVRDALADLPAEEVDDLTEGLEADLAEAYAEDLQRELPDPAAYATELRAAAGLPQRPKPASSGVLASLLTSSKDVKTDLLVAIRRNPGLSSALGFVDSLRPLWWITRAWLAAWLVAAFFGSERGFGMEPGWWLVLLVFAVISVQWGRGRWLARGVPTLIVLGNVVAVVAFTPVLAAADGWDSGGYEQGFEDGLSGATNDSSALALYGQPVTNIFAFDADGKALDNVQLFDQSGKPLGPYGPEAGNGIPCGDEDCMTLVQAGRLETGQSAYNIFPLRTVQAHWDDETGATVPNQGAAPVEPPAPYVSVPAVDAPKKVAKSND